jgi:hypothetical protein
MSKRSGQAVSCIVVLVHICGNMAIGVDNDESGLVSQGIGEQWQGCNGNAVFCRCLGIMCHDGSCMSKLWANIQW